MSALTSGNAEWLRQWPSAEHVPAEELARRQGVRPLVSADELAVPGMFESDEELDEFLTDLYASRRNDTPAPHERHTGDDVPMEGAPRVAVVLRPLLEIEGIALLLVTVEFWQDSTVLRVAAIPNATTARLTAEYEREFNAWAATYRRGMPETSPPPIGPGVRRLRHLGPRISDDVGTRYVLVSSGMGGTGSEWRGEWIFRSGPPPAATTLHIEAREGTDHHTMSVAIPPASEGPGHLS